MTAAEAARESIRLSAPPTPQDYKLELPADLQLPVGIDFKFEEANPALGDLKAVMHDIAQGKISGQQAFSKILGVYAASQVGSAAQIDVATKAEIAKLGPAGPARVDAVTTWLKSQIGDDLIQPFVQTLVTEKQVRGFEKLIQNFTSQGAAGFSQQHRDVTAVGKVTPEQYDKMSYSEKKEYSARFPQQAA